MQEPIGAWMNEKPIVEGYYWSIITPQDIPRLVRVKDGWIDILGTDDSFEDILAYQLFWSLPLIAPPEPSADLSPWRATREDALKQALMELDEAICFSVKQLRSEADRTEERDLMNQLQDARWHRPLDYCERIGELMIPLRVIAERIEAQKMVKAIDLYHAILKGR